MYIFVLLTSFSLIFSCIDAAPAETNVKIAKQKFVAQDQEGAFKEFLKIFEDTPPETTSCPFPQSYNEALTLYLSSNSNNLRETSLELINRFNPQEHPTSLIIASAYANLGEFPIYFDLLYAGYCAYPNHYLIHKSKAILHLKLFERCCPGPEKEDQRSQLQNEFSLAAEKYPKDTSLYRLMIAYAADSKKKQIVTSCLNRIIDNDIFIPRADLEYYIQNALLHADMNLAEKFVCRAKRWYEYSRTIRAAEQHLEKLKGSKS